MFYITIKLSVSAHFKDTSMSDTKKPQRQLWGKFGYLSGQPFLVDVANINALCTSVTKSVFICVKR